MAKDVRELAQKVRTVKVKPEDIGAGYIYFVYIGVES
nr:hypothetical protein [Peribacillus simplex]